MQQDTFNSSNKFKYAIIVLSCFFITKISTEVSVEITSTSTKDQIIPTTLEMEISTIPKDEIIPSTTSGMTVSTTIKEEIILSTPGITASTRDEIISSTPTTTEATISFSTEVIKDSKTDKISSLTSEKFRKIAEEELTSITTENEKDSITEEITISTREVEILPTSKIIQSENLKIGICASLNDCIKCVKSSDSCTWSVDENACKSPDDPSRNSSSGAVVSNENYPGEIRRKGASFCPRIVTSKNITVPYDTHKNIKIKVSMKNLFMTPPRFTCRFGDGPGAITTSATLLVDTIYCSNAYFSYPSDEPFASLPISVLHSGKKLSSPKDIKLIIYKCRYMADTCISCFSFGNDYECGWCPGSSTCEIAGQCEETTVENLWIGRRGLCPQFIQ